MFRDGFLKLLSTIKADVEVGEKFIPKFVQGHEVDECTIGLGEVFAMSGLDINAPGHWQLLFVGMLNEYASPPTRPRIRWSRENERLFIRRVIDYKRHNASEGILDVCKSLKRMYAEYTASDVTLQAQFQKSLREMRERVDDADEHPNGEHEAALVREFDALPKVRSM